MALARHRLALAQPQAGHLQQARADLKEAATLDPGLVESTLLLAELDIQAGALQPAIERLEGLVARQPRAVPMRALLGRVHLARRETDSAEVAFLEALELEPRLIEGYVELGGLHGSARKYDQALAKVNAGLAVNPKNVVTAANNVAWIHSEHGGEPAKDKALALAQMAKQVVRGVYQRALALLREGAVRLPDNAELQYHLGMAAARTGERNLARKALAVAAGSPAAFKGKEEARKALAELR